MRVANWPQVLDAKVEEWRARALVWGESDCCQLVGDFSVALTGEDQRSRFPLYSSQEEAQAILDLHGGMIGLLTAAFGEQKSAAQAKRGDVVAIGGDKGTLAAVCIGTRCVGPGPAGLVFRSMRDALCAWTV